MNSDELSVREISEADIPLIADYWLNADAAFLTGMGVDLAKMPIQEEWYGMLSEQIATPLPYKKSYCLIWLLNDNPVGHSNINKIAPGEEAYMHLHMWQNKNRTKGMGLKYVSMCLPIFFEAFNLKRICCEPYALNEAPNKTLEKAGFTFVRRHVTTPGWLNFEQEVNHWEITREQL